MSILSLAVAWPRSVTRDLEQPLAGTDRKSNRSGCDQNLMQTVWTVGISSLKDINEIRNKADLHPPNEMQPDLLRKAQGFICHADIGGNYTINLRNLWFVSHLH